jgi:hypothetical protein
MEQVKALVRVLDQHLTDIEQQGDILDGMWLQWNEQAKDIATKLKKRQITYATALPQLQAIATKSKYLGGKAKIKGGTWVYSQTAHQDQQEIPHAGSLPECINKDNITSSPDRTLTKDETPRESPNLLETPNSHASDTSEAAVHMVDQHNLEPNKYYELHIGDLAPESSHLSHTKPTPSHTATRTTCKQ